MFSNVKTVDLLLIHLWIDNSTFLSSKIISELPFQGTSGCVSGWQCVYDPDRPCLLHGCPTNPFSNPRVGESSSQVPSHGSPVTQFLSLFTNICSPCPSGFTLNCIHLFYLLLLEVLEPFPGLLSVGRARRYLNRVWLTLRQPCDT